MPTHRLFFALGASIGIAGCAQQGPAERYGFVALLGNDTVSLESVTRTGNTLTSDEVDRFPLVEERHTEVTLAPNGGVQHLVMDITTPSAPEEIRNRHVVADVTSDSVIMTKRDTADKRWAFATHGATVVAHVPQMYSLYELYFAAARKRFAASPSNPGDTVPLRQFYIDRQFDRFPLGHATLRRLHGDTEQVWHDWLAGIGAATVDSAGRLQHYSGAGTTYKVEVTRLSAPLNVAPVAAQFAALETKNGAARELSMRDVVHDSIGPAEVTVDYGRSLARGRQLLGGVVPYGEVWRTGANAATQFTTTAPITLAGLNLPAGTYTLWTLPKPGDVELIVNKQFGQWGTEYNPARDLGRARMTTDSASAPVEQFTISIVPKNAQSGTLAMAWGPFRWTAPIVVQSPPRHR
jgi:DUF2911 family protein